MNEDLGDGESHILDLNEVYLSGGDVGGREVLRHRRRKKRPQASKPSHGEMPEPNAGARSGGTHPGWFHTHRGDLGGR